MSTTRRRRKPQIAGLLLFSPKDQVRFVEAVERFQSLVNDLEVLVDSFKRKRGLPTAPPAAENDNPNNL